MAVEILERAGTLLSRYDVLVCDVWGVVHDGVVAYPGAMEALPRFRARGGRVVLLSNAPLPRQGVERVLEAKGVRRDAWDAIVSSGDLTRQHVEACGFRAVHHVGPDRDLGLFEGTGVSRVALETAEALVVTGLLHDDRETAEDYRPLLVRALGRDLEVVCANPDLVVEVGGVPHPCAGAIAALYEEMGGRVAWMGKPYPVAYRAAFAAAESLCGTAIDRQRVLAIGDAVRTDLAGAAAARIDALFVAQGIHRHDVVHSGAIRGEALDRVLGAAAPTTIAAILGLAW
jgi:HAD superfamily hydrolase (TIGR01459 family)